MPASVQSAIDRANTYILPVYARPPLVLSHGKGAYVWDTQGRKYLDFSAGIAVNALGHADEGVAQVSLVLSLVHRHVVSRDVGFCRRARRLLVCENPYDWPRYSQGAFLADVGPTIRR